jgi:colanic acid/amylovoran biosynthesis glycosyltransferase
MPTVAYITNQLPSPVEWYVVEEIRELERRGVEVVPCSARKPDYESLTPPLRDLFNRTICLQPLRPKALFQTLLNAPATLPRIKEVVGQALSERNTSLGKRLRMLIHTAYGLCLAALLKARRVQHIHVHHGYFSAWIAMIAARCLGIPFSMTLHGSDLLLHPAFMDIKLSECSFCLTISEFNRRHILAHFPAIDPAKIHVQRLGVRAPIHGTKITKCKTTAHEAFLLTVGRLHAVKNHTFLLQACYVLREWGMKFQCVIAGEGPERSKLEFLIEELRLQDVVTLVGHRSPDEVAKLYELADIVLLTSHSEGIPLVLMEAMAHQKIVLAPAITGIPELVVDGKTGFLYRPGSLEEFVWRVHQICNSLSVLEGVRQAAHRHVNNQFDLDKNIENFADFFVDHIAKVDGSPLREDLVLQQI